jgi:hypothetical protein
MLGRVGFLSRFGFTGRLMAIVLFALIALWSVGVGWVFVSESRDEIISELFPLPEQVAGIVELVETVGPSQRPAVLRAVSSENLRVTLAHSGRGIRPTRGACRWSSASSGSI